MNNEQYRANFLWGFPDESIEALGYEFANGKTEEYLKEVWEELVQKISEEKSIQFAKWYANSRWVGHLTYDANGKLEDQKSIEEIYQLFIKNTSTHYKKPKTNQSMTTTSYAPTGQVTSQVPMSISLLEKFSNELNRLSLIEDSFLNIGQRLKYTGERKTQEGRSEPLPPDMLGQLELGVTSLAQINSRMEETIKKLSELI